MNELVPAGNWGNIPKVPRKISGIFEELKELEKKVAEQQQEIAALKAEKASRNVKLLSADEIRAKLTPIIQSEIGYFHSRAKLSGPQGIMLSLGNLLNVLRNATKITGESFYYQKLFSCCDDALDQAMNDYMNVNFTSEMRVCRFVQVQLGELVNRGYATYDLGTYEAILLEQQVENTQQQPGKV